MKYASLVICVLATQDVVSAVPMRLQRRGRGADVAGNSLDADLSLNFNAENSRNSNYINPAQTLPPLPKTQVGSDEDDDFAGDEESSASASGGSNVFSLLSLVGRIFPGSSGSNARVRRLFQNFFFQNQRAVDSMERYINQHSKPQQILRRQDKENEIDIEEESSSSSQSSEEDSSEEESDERPDDTKNMKSNEQNGGAKSEEKKPIEQKSEERKSEEENNAAEESVETQDDKKSREDESSAESDYDEPPGGGDGEGGGLLGLLAGLSGGEDGQSDLGSLLATVSGIVVQLSGDGIDVNGLLASGIGLFVGLLSEGNENPGSVLAGYINTAVDTISGGGAQKNGAFFGSFISKLLKGISAGPEDSEEGGGGSDSAGFLLSLLMGLSGSSSGGGQGM